MDVTYDTNQSWFVVNILENKYNLLYLEFFKMRDNMHLWNNHFSKRMQSPRGRSGDSVGADRNG